MNIRGIAISILTGILAIIAYIAIAFFIGCQSAPVKPDYETADCYVFADCMYRNAKNPDKSVCAIMSEACRDSLKEWRIYKRLDFCKNNKFENMSENECRLWINQK